MSNAAKSIGFLNADQSGGCGYYRSFLPYAELKLKGWDAVYGAPAYLEEHGFACKTANKDEYVCGFKLVILKLIFDKIFLDQLPKKEKFNQIIVSDIDDFYPGLNEDNIAYYSTDPKNNPDINRNHLQEIWMKSDALITSTKFLYDYYSKIHNDVYLIRNGIDMNRYQIRHDTASITPTIGWVGATPWRTKDLLLLAPIMEKFLKKNNCWFHHAGNIEGQKEVANIMKISNKIVTKKPMIPISLYPILFTDFDIGIVPLVKNDFNQAKSFIKGLEYAAAGIPFIATDTEEYKYLHDYGIGRIAANEDEWEKHLTELLNPQTRAIDAENNWRRVNESFHMVNRGREWQKIMSKFYK